MRQGGPNPQEFITKVTQELQESIVMRDSRRLPGVAPHPGKDGGLRVCIDVLGLNRAASQERLWPSRVGVVRVHLTATFAYPSAFQTLLLPTSA